EGKPDMVAAGTVVSVLLGNGDGTFGPKLDYGAGNSPVSVAIGDLNRDGRPDLVAANYGSNTVSVLLNIGLGGPTPVALALVDASAGSGRVELNWYGASMAGRTATVQRQAEGFAWSALATIAA